MSAAIAKKMLAASKMIGHVGKNGENSHFKFKFQAWDDVLPAVRDACCEVGLSVLPSCRLIERVADLSMLELTILLTDTDSGESLTLQWVGEAKDNQDKGFQKAATSGYKYLLLKAFMIPVVGDDDPDRDGPKQRSPAEPKREAKAPDMTVDLAKSIIGQVGNFTTSELKDFWAPYAAARVGIVEAAKLVKDCADRDAMVAILDGLKAKDVANVA